MTAQQRDRLDRVKSFMNELTYLPISGNHYFNNTGKLTDMQRLLQVLTNTAYMEAKTQSLISKRDAV